MLHLKVRVNLYADENYQPRLHMALLLHSSTVTQFTSVTSGGCTQVRNIHFATFDQNVLLKSSKSLLPEREIQEVFY